MLPNRFKQIIHFTLDSAPQVTPFIDPFDQLILPDDSVETRITIGMRSLGLIPSIIMPRVNKDWRETIEQNYRTTSGGPACNITGDVKTVGYIWKGVKDGDYQEPDLLPLAIFENVYTLEKFAFYQYSLCALFSKDHKLEWATRLD